MFLDTSALYLLERHRAYEAELQRDGVMARHRAEIRLAAEPVEPSSDDLRRVSIGDGPGGRRDPRPNLGRP
jgi:hypothetical protein